MVNIIFIIACHEQPKCIVDMILNIRTMNPTIADTIGFSLHISKNYIFEDDNDYYLFNNMMNGTLFPQEYNVKINTTRYETRWGSISVPLVSTLKYACDMFPHAQKFVLLASNCLQTYFSPKLLYYPAGLGYDADYGASYRTVYPIDTGSHLLRHKFIKKIFDMNNGDCSYAYGIHEGLFMSRIIAVDFLKIWFDVYTNEADMCRDNDIYGCTEEYVFQTYLYNLKKKRFGGSMCHRQPEYVEVVDRPTSEVYFVKPVKRSINLPLRKMMREKYGYVHLLNNILTTVNKQAPIKLIYKNTDTKYYDGQFSSCEKFNIDVCGNYPRTIYLEFKSNVTKDVCLFASGTATANKCFNIILDKKVKIMCYSNDINDYPSKNFNDNEWHSIAVVLGINVVYIYIDELLVFSKPLHGINTTGTHALLGMSNHLSFERPYQGSMRNVMVWTGLVDPRKDPMRFDMLNDLIKDNRKP